MTIPTAVLLTILWWIFCLVDALLFSKTLFKPTVTLDEFRAHGIWRFAPGSGFYLAWKYRNR